ncbi:translation elongation factor P/translation initiation factor 5A [Paenibacillus anaericanus]|uniref:S-layer homology domain-containing protein n=1 Tax=Paenibacillus anaericanus TaxID=170367 RepID=UPI0027870D82|nr:S-layer homology domain-containing protein [Paenibacillus anaericanus]MDQ0088017.1 translation elongation factor P/translation initiation factor 5A [Paenibacillus anaericanus]
MSSFKRSFTRNTKKAVSTMLVTAMCLSGGAAVFADQATTPTAQSVAAVSIFSDVKDGFWAEKHIYKLAAEGIILGDAGKFRPSDSVTQQEAITMAIRFMNLDSKLGNGEGSPTELTVSKYFKPYLELAVSQNLIDKSEEIAATGAKESWGEKKASREWIAKILVRALGKETEAKASAGQATGFADHDKITASARGYVNVAVQLDITKGVEGNKFDPLGKVTRAQIATFLSRGGDHFNPGYSNVYEGIVTELTDSKVTLTANGKMKSFTLDNRSVYFTKDSELKATKAELKPYTKVLIVDKVGSAAYVEVVDAKAQLESTEGTLLRMLSGNRMLLLVNNDSVTYTYDDNTAFMDQNGNAIKAESLTPDSTLVVQRETYSGANKPIIVQVKSAIVNKSGKGTISSVNVTDKTLSIKDASGNTETFKFDDSAAGTIVRYQSQILTLGELKADMAVSYVVKNNVLDSIEVSQGVERTVTGTLISVEGNSLLSYKNASGYPEVKLLVEKPKVVINGINDATLADLIADLNGGDKVELTLDPQERVTQIVVQGRQSEVLSDAAVVNYDSKSKTLTVLDSAKKPHVFVVNDKSKLDYNSTAPTLSGIESLLTKDRKINITHIGERVLSLQVIYKYEGTFLAANTTTKIITVQLADGKTVAVPYQGSQPSIELFGKSNATVNDIKLGDPVTVILSANQDTLQTLAIKSVVQFEVSSVNTANSRIRAVSNGLSSEFYVNQATLLDENGNVIKLSNLEAGQTINVTFNGQTAVAVQVVKLTLGKIQAVDGSNLTLKPYSGGTEIFSLSGGVKVLRGTSVSTGITSLTTSDHVEVRKASDGGLVVNVLTVLERKVSRYDANNKEILVIRASLSDNNFRFAVTPETYIHQGDTTLSVQSLKENDKIVLYFNGDKLVEVEKQ